MSIPWYVEGVARKRPVFVRLDRYLDDSQRLPTENEHSYATLGEQVHDSVISEPFSSLSPDVCSVVARAAAALVVAIRQAMATGQINHQNDKLHLVVIASEAQGTVEYLDSSFVLTNISVGGSAYVTIPENMCQCIRSSGWEYGWTAPPNGVYPLGETIPDWKAECDKAIACIVDGKRDLYLHMVDTTWIGTDQWHLLGWNRLKLHFSIEPPQWIPDSELIDPAPPPPPSRSGKESEHIGCFPWREIVQAFWDWAR